MTQVAYGLAMVSRGRCSMEGEPLTWLGITKDETANTWRYHGKGRNVTFFNWAPGQPNGDDLDECVVMKGNSFKGGWADHSCRKSYKVCVLCTLPMPVFLRFRGICDSTLYDDRFVMASTRNGKPYFRGYYRSHIYYTDHGSWRLENIFECLISGIPFALHIKNMRIFTIVPTVTSAHYGTLHPCLVTTT
ncbi:hypothetical protein GWK47_015700 [Chionoecetes opilio]|uniref:C-type lectin domain-containing protein n=1 Tax=Chionoecetes opilio TaxID=41210 RepID=A0A8J4XX28_CHIOP|nr:hypothetical protein GWK47_015700 [Chionoecetes opilio]